MWMPPVTLADYSNAIPMQALASAVDDSVSDAKNTARHRIKARRQHMTAAARMAASAQICQHLLQNEHLRTARCVAAFAAMEDEVNIWPLIKQLASHGVMVALPRVRGGRRMTFHAVDAAANGLQKSRFGIWQPPAHFPIIAPEEFDFCIVPALAVNAAKYRLGYGGGFYDTFKNHCQALCAAPVFRCQQTESFPVESHDMQVDMIFSEDNTLSKICG